MVGPSDWDAVVSDASGPQLVVGGPGTGKTEFLVRRARSLIDGGVPPEQILVLSFSRRGAADLKARIADGLGRSFTVIPASTFHSLAMRIVEAHGSAGDWPMMPTLLTGPEHVQLVADVLGSEDPNHWPLPYRPLLTHRSFADEVADFSLRAAERLIGPDELRGFDRADWRAIPAFLERYRAALIDRGRIDYGSLQVEALTLLDDPAIHTEIAGQFRYVIVDEYQDTTITQARIVERLASSHRNLTVTGDPYQSVYSFRGAEVSNIAEFPSRFIDADGRPARRIVLSTSFRVPAAILEAAVRLTVGGGLPGAAGAVTPAPGNGSVETYGFDQQSAEAEWIAEELQRVHLRDAIPYSRMGVLVRTKRKFLRELSRALDRRRIPHLRPDSRLADHRAVRPILDLAEAAAGVGDALADALRRVLMGPLIGLTLSATREIERRAVTGGWPAALAGAHPEVDPLAALLAEPAWADDIAAADGFWTLWTSLPRLAAMALNDAGDRMALSSLSQALDRLRERDPEASLAAYAAMARAEDFEAQPLISYRREDVDRVTLTTLHQAKGMEFDVVVIADAREGVLPDLRVRDSLLGSRHLSPSQGSDDRSYLRFRLQEERRLAYTAMCRARTRVIWTCTITSPAEGGGSPSRFLPLVSGRPIAEAVSGPAREGAPTTPLEGEAWLRRRVGDPSLPGVDRLAALGALAAPDPWRPRPMTEYAGVRAPGPDTGLVGPDTVLSPSQAESFAECPRKYAFERRLRISGGGSMYADLGGLIHAVLEKAEREAVDGGSDHADVTRALEILALEFEPARFGGSPWADSWLSRAQRILAHLYEYWPGQGTAVGFETSVEYDLDGVHWTGRVDRAERRTDGIHIVDYKTGTSVPTVDEAGTSIQLGFYVLASSPGVAGAELWFPGDDPGKRKSVAVRRFSMDRLTDVVASLRDTQRRILREQWDPTPGPHCERCPVRIVCPVWPEGRESFAS